LKQRCNTYIAFSRDRSSELRSFFKLALSGLLCYNTLVLGFKKAASLQTTRRRVITTKVSESYLAGYEDGHKDGYADAIGDLCKALSPTTRREVEAVMAAASVRQSPATPGSQISKLRLDSHTRNILERAGISCVGQLLALTEDELLRIRRIGSGRYEEIMNALEAEGLLAN
jgi:hypothetical protein